MKTSLTQRSRLLRLGIPLLLAWSVAWLLGITTLASIAIQQRAERRDADLDTQLALYATAVYGLTWFDEQGRFHDELLRLEPDLNPAAFDAWVVEPDTPPVTHITPEHPQFALTDFSFLSGEVMQQARKVYHTGKDKQGADYRLYAIPTYTDQPGSTTPKAMIIVVADPVPGHVEYQAFAQRIWLAAMTLGGIGLLVGAGLSYWSLRPAFAALHQRERFLSATAHELRTPVAALRVLCESARQGDEDPQAILQRMDALLHSTSHTLEDLLLFARLDAGATLEREPVRLDLLVETLLPDDGSVSLDANASVVSVDPRLASVAVRNLLDNARKHGQSSGQTSISVTVSGACIVVEDQGNGFSNALLMRRENDFALSPTQGGSGLGLAIVNLIASLHGGSLKLENRQPQGARASLQFSA